MANKAVSSRKFHPGERVELTITGIAHGGESVARLDGWVFFVRYAIPGEQVIAEITQLGKSFHRADAMEIITPSMDRVTTACSYFHPNGCGGCDFQHISLKRQRELKAQVITEQFKRMAKMDIDVPVQEVIISPDSGARYRGRLSLHIDSQGRAGFHKARSHEVLPIADCLVASEKLELVSVLSKKYPGIKELNIPDEARIEEISVRGKKYSYRVSRESFWQGHVRAAEVLGSAALEILEPQAGERALDLYGGVGLFGKLIADYGAQVDIIESSTPAVRDGIFNLREYENARYHEGDVAKVIQSIDRADIVLLDPPRSGAEPEVLTKIASLAPRKICYISCDPASLARDCQRLSELGYTPVATAAFDLFPQTAHIECVFAFERVIS